MDSIESILMGVDSQSYPRCQYQEKSNYMEWKSTSSVVKSAWTLPIPVLTAGSSISYYFETSGGDIDFSVTFMSGPKSQDENILVAESRVASDKEAVQGQFTVHEEGLVSFKWNNEFSWFLPKYLTYNVSIQLPEFSLVEFDDPSCIRARSALRSAITDSTIAKKKLLKYDRIINEQNEALPILEARMLELQLLLSKQTARLGHAVDEMESTERRAILFDQKIAGLNIRCLPKKLLSVVLSFLVPALDPRSQSSSLPECEVMHVCKYWHSICRELINNLKIRREGARGAGAGRGGERSEQDGEEVEDKINL